MKENLKIKKWQIIMLMAIGLCFIFLKFWQARWPEEELMIKNIPIKVIVADNPMHRHKGLGGRKNLDGYDAMLFVFPNENQHGIVMRDMEFPIDIVWLNKGKVIDLVTNVQIELRRMENELTVYYPRINADMVLEFPAGWVLKNKLKIGDSLELNK